MAIRILLLIFLLGGTPCFAAEDKFTVWVNFVTSDPLRESVLTVLGVSCGTMSLAEQERLQKARQTLDAAGDKALPVIAELIPHEYCGPWFIGQAARYATKFPQSPELHASLHAHRNDEKILGSTAALFGIFDYYVKFGNEMQSIFGPSVI